MLKRFKKGGIHPPENKLTAHLAIEKLPLPDSVVIPVSQHLGKDAIPSVKKGEKVKVGQVIATGSGAITANIHASISGEITKVDQSLDTSGYKKLSISIKREDDLWDESIDTSHSIISEINLSSEDIITRIEKCGVVGLGGATFPTHFKLKISAEKKCEYLIVNGVECEPYLTSDHRLMLEKADEIIIGIQIILKALHAEKAIIGIENNKTDAISLFKQKLKNQKNIAVIPLKVIYPQGGEKQLIEAVTNREVPSGKLPIDVGVVVLNVGTIFSVYEAVQKNKPLIERVVTLTGPHLKTGGNYLVRIGTPINQLLTQSAVETSSISKVISGGPMMGKALYSLDVPVVKGMSGILLLSENEAKRELESPCIRCAKCVVVCPQGLSPQLLSAYGERRLYERAEESHTLDCMECGSCSYVCPANRPILDFIRIAKTNVKKIISERRTKS